MVLLPVGMWVPTTCASCLRSLAKAVIHMFVLGTAERWWYLRMRHEMGLMTALSLYQGWFKRRGVHGGVRYSWSKKESATLCRERRLYMCLCTGPSMSGSTTCGDVFVGHGSGIAGCGGGILWIVVFVSVGIKWGLGECTLGGVTGMGAFCGTGTVGTLGSVAGMGACCCTP